MTTHDVLLPVTVLQRKAVVYVRQSTPQQVQSNLESQRRQYELVEVARRRGFASVEVIDDDLGRTASGAVERPGFDRLVAALCAGQVGAVLCLDASRLARNGRDWHHLLELCGLVEARVIDLDGVYDPCLPNDRLLLGMKGSISEFELGIIRSRMYEAARSKARRGELRIFPPIGYTWACRSRPRSGSPAAGGDKARLSEVPRAGQRPTSAIVDGVAEHPLSLSVRWQNVDVDRMAADQVS
jgi:DNA invertase Pin-like site-specific DNA recombinase